MANRRDSKDSVNENEPIEDTEDKVESDYRNWRIPFGTRFPSVTPTFEEIANSNHKTFGSLKKTTDRDQVLVFETPTKPNSGTDEENKAPESATSTSKSSVAHENIRRGEYYEQIKTLNDCVSKYITLKLTTDPYLILNPIFLDYKKNVDLLHIKYPIINATKTSTPNELPAKSANYSGENEEPEPRYQELDNCNEEDGFYSIRCKCFFLKDKVYIEKCVGTLFLKSLQGRNQLLIRDDISGEVVLNVPLKAEIPIMCTQKSVSLVCTTSLPFDSDMDQDNPVTFLIKLKSEEEAVQLFEKLQLYKKNA